jgi:hypothetical protein
MIVGHGCVLLPLGLMSMVTIVGHGCVLLPLGLINLVMIVGHGCVLLPLGLIESGHDSRAWLRPSAFRPD